MPDRFWVGGAGTWNATNTANWSATSGGSGGASAPTVSDDVFFNAGSNGASAFTVTIATGAAARSINCTGFTRTISGTGAITVAGSVTLVAAMTYTHTGTMTFTGTGTLTTAGKTFSGVEVLGSGITLTLGDALNVSTRAIDVDTGTFDTANFAVTVGVFRTSGTATRVITLGSSTVTVSSSLNFAFPNTLTVNAGTSQINMSSASASFSGAGETFRNVSFTSTAVGSRALNDVNTFNNLTLVASGSGLSQLAISANQIVNGTFTCAGSSATQRGFVRSSAIGTARTITAAAVSATNCDFRDITIAGAAAPISPTRGGDCGGNSGITFPAAKTVYWNLAGAQNWNSTGWATTSNGTPAVNNFPLAQDTVVFTDDGAAGTVSLGAAYNIGALDASARTSAMTLSHNVFGVSRYGSYTLGSGVTVTGTSDQTFSGRGTMVFTSAGKTITFPIIVDAPGGTFELGDAFASSGGITLNRGTFDAKNYSVTCITFVSNIGGNTRTITMGSGLWTLSGTGTVWNTSGTTGLTFNKDTADILLSNTTTSARTFVGGGLSYNKLTIGGATGTSITTLTGVNSFTELASTKTVAHTLRFGNNQGTIGTWSITGTVGNVVTFDSNTAGTRRTFNLTNVTSGIDYLAVRDIGVNQANRFYVGTNSTDNGNNLNVIFTDPPAVTATGNMLLLFTP